MKKLTQVCYFLALIYLLGHSAFLAIFDHWLGVYFALHLLCFVFLVLMIFSKKPLTTWLYSLILLAHMLLISPMVIDFGSDIIGIVQLEHSLASMALGLLPLPIIVALVLWYWPSIADQNFKFLKITTGQ